MATIQFYTHNQIPMTVRRDHNNKDRVYIHTDLVDIKGNGSVPRQIELSALKAVFALAKAGYDFKFEKRPGYVYVYFDTDACRYMIENEGHYDHDCDAARRYGHGSIALLYLAADPERYKDRDWIDPEEHWEMIHREAGLDF